MSWLRAAVVIGSLGAVACGRSESDPPLILGSTDGPAAPGPRTLTSSQSKALQRKITTAGAPCEQVHQTYLRDITAGAEAWEVRCSDGAYTVLLSSETPGLVRRCVEAPFDEPPCFVPPSYGFGRRNRNPGPLNPELGKLLEPMTTKKEKSD